MQRSVSLRGQYTALLGLLGLGSAILLGGLGSFGIWDPWELTVADQARAIESGGPLPVHDPRGAMLAALGFRLLGVHEWAGRLPAALCGACCVALALLLARRFAGLSAGVAAGVVTLSSPLFLLNALPMGGHVLGMMLQAITVSAGLCSMVGPKGEENKRLGLLALALFSAGGSTAIYGLLTGALAPMLALSAAAVMLLLGRFPGMHADPRTATALALAGLVDALLVLRAIALDEDGYSIWTGGTPHGLTPPGFDIGLERLFHSLAPWSALLPMALALPVLVNGRGDGSEAERSAQSSVSLLSATAVAWCAAGYGAQTLFLARFGESSVFLPVVGVGLAVACLLVQLPKTGFPTLFVGLVAALLCGLLIRDFALFPEGPLEGMPVTEFSVPEVFNPKSIWALLLAAFAAALVLPFATEEPSGNLDPRAPYRLLKQQFGRGPAFVAWLGVLAATCLCLLIAGTLAWLSPATLQLSSLGGRVARVVALLLLLMPLGVFGIQLLAFGCARLGRYRTAPVLVVAGLLGLYVTHGFLPSLSGHLSPREVYESFNTLAGPKGVLAEYKVGGGAASYYVDGDVEHLDSYTKLVSYMLGKERRWAAIRAKDLPSIDGRYRHTEGRHLVVADASNARIMLVTNQPVAGRSDQNPLREVVLDQAPVIKHPIQARFGRDIELLGYDLKSRLEGSVGAGETFTMTWYYRVLRRVTTDHRLFVHVDGHSTRVHGDHDPVGGNYPMHLWEAGDIIVDRHAVDVPASTPVGDYEILMGFYKGDRRLPVEEGPHDEADRVRVGVLRIR